MLAHESSTSHKNTQIPSPFCLYAVMPNICWLSFSIILNYPLKTYCFPKYWAIQLFAYHLLILYFPCIWEFFLHIFTLFIFVSAYIAPSVFLADTSTNLLAFPMSHLQLSLWSSGHNWCHLEERQSVLTVICTLMKKINNYYSCKPVSFEVICCIEVDNWFTHFSLFIKVSWS